MELSLLHTKFNVMLLYKLKVEIKWKWLFILQQNQADEKIMIICLFLILKIDQLLYLSWKGLFSEVIVLHGLFRSDSFCRVHGQQLGEKLEGLALRLDAMPVHVLHQRAVQVTEIDCYNHSLIWK